MGYFNRVYSNIVKKFKTTIVGRHLFPTSEQNNIPEVGKPHVTVRAVIVPIELSEKVLQESNLLESKVESKVRTASNYDETYLTFFQKEVKKRLFQFEPQINFLQNEIDRLAKRIVRVDGLRVSQLRVSNFITKPSIAALSPDQPNFPDFRTLGLYQDREKVRKEDLDKEKLAREKRIFEHKLEVERLKKEEEFTQNRRIEELINREKVKEEITHLERKRLNKNLEETGTVYADRIYNVSIASFSDIKINSNNQGDEVHYSLRQGVAVLKTHEQLEQYIYSYGKMHELKLLESLEVFKEKEVFKKGVYTIIDWGCGQALGSTILLDFIKENNITININQILLIDGSELAIKRGILHLNKLLENEKVPIIKMQALDLNNLGVEHLDGVEPHYFHIFSNILDVVQIDLRKIFSVISDKCKGRNTFLTVSPNIYKERNERLDSFCDYFKDIFGVEIHSERAYSVKADNGREYKRYELLYSTNIRHEST